MTNKMNFFQRVVTSVLLLPLLIWVIHNGGPIFAATIVMAQVLLATEISQMANPRNKRAMILFAMSASVFMLALVLTKQIESSLYLMWLMLFVATVVLVFHPGVLLQHLGNLAVALMVLFYSLVGFCSIYLLRESLTNIEMGRAFLYLALLCTFGNDTVAYLVGKKWGKTKLIPRVSEKKTWEGFTAGALASVCLPFLLHLLSRYFFAKSPFDSLSYANLFFIGVGISFLGPLGDLIESRIKRLFGVKDSGTLLPGHGGLFDRVDALLVTVPFTLCYALFLQTM